MYIEKFSQFFSEEENRMFRFSLKYVFLIILYHSLKTIIINTRVERKT